MLKYYSIGLKLNDVIKDKDTEQVILENIKRCSRMVGKFFKVVFWHEDLTKKQCEAFVRRNEKLLFEVNTKITKTKEPVWFLIGSSGAGRYRFDGDILQGISEYIKIISHIKKRDNNEI